MNISQWKNGDRTFFSLEVDDRLLLIEAFSVIVQLRRLIVNSYDNASVCRQCMPTIDSGLWSSIRRNWTQSQMWSSRAQRGAVSYPSRAFFQIKYNRAMFRVAQTTALPSGLHHLGQIIITPLLHSRISILGFWIITTGRGGVMAQWPNMISTMMGVSQQFGFWCSFPSSCDEKRAKIRIFHAECSL